jgi:GH25 family lysozyme M1 (1,4-beta-N-acetylmuramidase)
MSNQNTRTNPYVGPRSFQVGEKLFGRDYELHELTNLLIAERIVLLHSPSGAGKSSLIQAGMIPRLQDEGFLVMPSVRVGLAQPEVTLHPGFNRYVYSTLASLDERLPEDERHNPGELATMNIPQYLDDDRSRHTQPNLVLTFDQFEEILTIDPNDISGKNTFFAQLGEALRDRSRWALFAMREDHLPALAPYMRPVPTHLSNTYRLDFLNIDSAVEAIRQPAKLGGADFTKEAAQKLIDDLRRVQTQLPDGSVRIEQGQVVEPLQLQVVCYRLWESLASDDTFIDESDIDALGDVDRSLSEYYNQRLAEIARQSGVPERTIRTWFQDQLITSTGLRGQVLLEQGMSKGLDNNVIRQLENAHLVRAEKRGGSIWYELAHDRLIAPVRENNQAWFDANLSLLQKQAALWETQGRPEGLLLRGNELAQAEEWARKNGQELDASERRFLNGCQQALRREQETQQLREQTLLLESERKRAEAEQARAEMEGRRADEQLKATRRIRALAIIIGAFAVIAIALAVWASTQRKQALDGQNTAVALLTDVADASKLALRVQNTQSADIKIQSATQQGAALSDLSTQQAQMAVQSAPTSTPEVSAGPDLRAISQDLAASSQKVEPIDLSLLLAAQADQISSTYDSRRALLLNLQAGFNKTGGSFALPLVANAGKPTSLAISPDGGNVTFTAAGSLMSWNISDSLKSGQPVSASPEPKISPGSVRYAFYNPSGSLLALVSAGSDRLSRPGAVTSAEGLTASYWDGKIDWTQAKAGGIQFAYVKATQGNGSLDKTFADNWFGMKSAGVLRGSYHYFDFGIRPEDQADYFLSVVSLEPGDLPPALDVEGKIPDGMPVTDAIAAIHTWLDRVQKGTGRVPVIAFLANQSWAKVFTSDEFKQYPLWVIQNQKDPSSSQTINGREWTFWLYKLEGQVAGAPKNISLLRYNGSAADLLALAYGSYVQDAGTGAILYTSNETFSDPLASKSGSLVAYAIPGQPFQVADTATFSNISLPDAFKSATQVLGINDNANFLVMNTPASGAGILGTDGVFVPLDLGSARSATYAAFSQDNHYLAVISATGEVSVWDVSYLNSVKNITRFKPNETPTSLALNFDGRLLAIGQGSGAILLFDLSFGKELTTFTPADNSQVTRMVFNPLADILVTAGDDGQVLLWDLRTDTLLRQACAIAARDLTQEEWNTYITELAYRPTCRSGETAK